MIIIITHHMKKRIKDRGFSESLVKEIVLNTTQVYYDTLNKSYAAFATKRYRGKHRKIGVFFHYEGQNVKIRTAHLESDKEVNNRIN